MLFIRADCVLSCSHFAHWGKFGILRYINNTISTCCWESNLILFFAPSCTAHWVCQSNRVLPFYHKDNIFVSASLLHFQYTLPTSEAILSDRDSDSAKAQQRLMLILSSVLHPYRTTFPFSGDYLSVQPSEQDEQVCVPSAASNEWHTLSDHCYTCQIHWWTWWLNPRHPVAGPWKITSWTSMLSLALFIYRFTSLPT